MEKERQIVVPGETIISGEDYLPGDGVYRDGDEIVAARYGLAETSDKLVKVIALSGVYVPRRGNIVLGEIVDITFNGWIVDFGGSVNGFLPLTEVPMYVNKDEMAEVLNFGDVISARVQSTRGRSLDLSIKMRNLGKFDEGMVVNINPNKVPRVIGKEGSMVGIIKEATGCDIVVGQNGWVWIRGDKVEDELKAEKVINYICENSFIDGLTDKVKEYIEKL